LPMDTNILHPKGKTFPSSLMLTHP
jgi:hypothetical protein